MVKYNIYTIAINAQDSYKDRDIYVLAYKH